ncbi:aminopeptidase N C-terminal domain-containing protein, partial [Salmonella enterica subsp. enterica serovar Kentucky]|nr:aminopeptidase N C-terminal domain-containing protein [Salmonella enterica subsp. enterica serovar Kentucky]
LLCEFSAPVKLEYKWSDQQLTFLMRHARNDFSRWDAAQSLLATYIKLNNNRAELGWLIRLTNNGQFDGQVQVTDPQGRRNLGGNVNMRNL